MSQKVDIVFSLRKYNGEICLKLVSEIIMSNSTNLIFSSQILFSCLFLVRCSGLMQCSTS